MRRKSIPIHTSDMSKIQNVYDSVKSNVANKQVVLDALASVFISDCTVILHDVFDFDLPVSISAASAQPRESTKFPGYYTQSFIVHLPNGVEPVIQIGFPVARLVNIRFFSKPRRHILEFHRVVYRNDHWYWAEAVEAFARQIWFLYLEFVEEEIEK